VVLLRPSPSAEATSAPVVAEVPKTGGTPWRLPPAERERVIKDHVALVHYVVGRVMVTLPASVDREDLISAGIVGLIRAVDRFDPSRGVKFDTYATTVIRGEVMETLRSEDWLPRSVRHKSRQLQQTISDLEFKLGRPPDDAEIAAALQLSLDDYYQLLSTTSPITLLNLDDILTGMDVTETDEERLVAPGEFADPERISQDRELKRLVAGAVEGLPSRERIVVALYYHEELTLKEIGEILAVTESRVCQIHTQALLRLRSRLQEELRQR